MSKPVLFASGVVKSIERAENLKCLYDAYQGDKKYISIHDPHFRDEVKSGKYDLMVIDIFPTMSPGKAIMVWHAIQGGKYIGLDEAATYYQPPYAMLMNRIVVAGHGAIDMFKQCTHVPEKKILNLGMPRTDRYVGKKKGDGNTELAHKKSYLYAPTYRTKQETPLPSLDLEWIDSELDDDELFVIKSHPFTKLLNIGQYKHIIEIPASEPSVNYLYDCDAVVTDYSSIMFDAYLLNKPVVLLEKIKGYTETRGMYLDYPNQYSSRFTDNEYDMLYLLRTADGLTDVERECINLVADACDGHSCERICKLIHELNESR